MIEKVTNVDSTARKRLIALLMQKGFGVEGATIAADHLLANGVIVPPCKAIALPCVPGDTVYDIFMGEVKKKTALSVSALVSRSFQGISIFLENERGAVTQRTPRDFGKTVFLNYKEAEQALKEREQS